MTTVCTPRRDSVPHWPGRSGAPGWCSTMRCAPASRPTQPGLPYITDAELSARLTAAKATVERVWLSEVSSVVLQQALADLNTAYRNFFASITGKRRGPKIAAPRQ